ncbi:MAG: hypothetical protein AB1556_04890 [Bacillota bacterium]
MPVAVEKRKISPDLLPWREKVVNWWRSFRQKPAEDELDSATITAAPEISLIYYYAGKEQAQEKEAGGGRRRLAEADRSTATGEVKMPRKIFGKKVTLSGKAF